MDYTQAFTQAQKNVLAGAGYTPEKYNNLMARALSGDKGANAELNWLQETGTPKKTGTTSSASVSGAGTTSGVTPGSAPGTKLNATPEDTGISPPPPSGANAQKFTGQYTPAQLTAMSILGYTPESYKSTILSALGGDQAARKQIDTDRIVYPKIEALVTSNPQNTGAKDKDTKDTKETNANPYSGQVAALLQALQESINTPTAQYTPPNVSSLSFNDALSQAKTTLDPMYHQTRQDTAASNQLARRLLRQRLGAKGQLDSGGLPQGEIDLEGIKAKALSSIDVGYNAQSAQMAQGLQQSSQEQAQRQSDQAYRQYMDQQQLGQQRTGNMLNLLGTVQSGAIETDRLAQGESQFQRELAENQRQFDASDALARAKFNRPYEELTKAEQADIDQGAATLTGYYQGQPTMAKEGQQFDQAATEAGLTGYYDGQATLDREAEERAARQFAEEMGYKWESLSQQEQESLRTDAREWAKIDQSAKEFAEGMGLEWAKLDETIKNNIREDQRVRLGISVDRSRVGESIRSNKAQEGLQNKGISRDDATSLAISQAMDYGTAEEAYAALAKYGADMAAKGVDMQAVTKAIQNRWPNDIFAGYQQ